MLTALLVLLKAAWYDGKAVRVVMVHVAIQQVAAITHMTGAAVLVGVLDVLGQAFIKVLTGFTNVEVRAVQLEQAVGEGWSAAGVGFSAGAGACRCTEVLVCQL